MPGIFVHKTCPAMCKTLGRALLAGQNWTQPLKQLRMPSQKTQRRLSEAGAFIWAPLLHILKDETTLLQPIAVPSHDICPFVSVRNVSYINSRVANAITWTTVFVLKTINKTSLLLYGKPAWCFSTVVLCLFRFVKEVHLLTPSSTTITWLLTSSLPPWLLTSSRGWSMQAYIARKWLCI